MPPFRGRLSTVRPRRPVAPDAGAFVAVDERAPFVRGDQDAVAAVAVRVGGHETAGSVAGGRALGCLGQPVGDRCAALAGVYGERSVDFGCLRLKTWLVVPAAVVADHHVALPVAVEVAERVGVSAAQLLSVLGQAGAAAGRIEGVAGLLTIADRMDQQGCRARLSGRVDLVCDESAVLLCQAGIGTRRRTGPGERTVQQHHGRTVEPERREIVVPVAVEVAPHNGFHAQLGDALRKPDRGRPGSLRRPVGSAPGHIRDAARGSDLPSCHALARDGCDEVRKAVAVQIGGDKLVRLDGVANGVLRRTGQAQVPSSVDRARRGGEALGGAVDHTDPLVAAPGAPVAAGGDRNHEVAISVTVDVVRILRSLPGGRRPALGGRAGLPGSRRPAVGGGRLLARSAPAASGERGEQNTDAHGNG